MSDPVSWQLLEHVQAALKLVTVARGYFTDLGLAVVALEGDQLPEDDTPYTAVLATDLPIDEEASTRSTTRTDMEITVEFAVPFAADQNANRAAHRARADVIRALIPLRKNPKDRPLGVSNFQITGSTIGTPEGGAAVVIAQVTARAGLTESNQPASP